MILIGQYDSPFVRRIGIALRLYGLPFEHRPWSVFGDAERIRPLNPLVRVPTLVLDDGDVIVDSHAMIDYLDGLMPAEKRLYPTREPDRHRAMRIAMLATGLGEQGVAIFYAGRLQKDECSPLLERRRGQMQSVIAALEADRGHSKSPYWHGERIGHADIAVAAVLRFLADASLVSITEREQPALAGHCARMEALPVFREISQPYKPPA